MTKQVRCRLGSRLLQANITQTREGEPLIQLIEVPGIDAELTISEIQDYAKFLLSLAEESQDQERR